MIKIKNENQGWFELKMDAKGLEKDILHLGKYKTLQDVMDAYADYRGSLLSGILVTRHILHLEYWEFDKDSKLITKIF